MKIVDSHKQFFLSCICILAALFITRVGFEIIEEKPIMHTMYTGQVLK